MSYDAQVFCKLAFRRQISRLHTKFMWDQEAHMAQVAKVMRPTVDVNNNLYVPTFDLRSCRNMIPRLRTKALPTTLGPPSHPGTRGTPLSTEGRYLPGGCLMW